MCLAHTAKLKLHTAKTLSCVAHGKEHTVNSPTVNLTFTHGQIMDTRRSFVVSQYSHTVKKGNRRRETAGFAVCQNAGTRQSLNVCRVPGLGTRQTPTKKSKVLNFYASLWPLGFKLITSLSCIFILNHYTTL